MDELCALIMNHLVLDFEGEANMDVINEMLVRDGGPVARDLRARLIAEQGPDSFLLVLVDCLKESLRDGISEKQIKDQVKFYLDA